MKNIVFFTGSGISAESGIQTFREAGAGLWENFRIEEVCTHEAILMDRPKVVRFYNDMRRQMLTKQPNVGHKAIAEMQNSADLNGKYRVQVVTQNVDDLHERAGSTGVVHLHGEIMKLRSSRDERAAIGLTERPDLFRDGWEQRLDDCHPDGSLLRPFIVFFGEGVPEFERAIEVAQEADVFVVVGSSLVVYPAASLLDYVRPEVPIFVVDPGEPSLGQYAGRVHLLRKPASVGIPEVIETIMQMA